MATEKPRITVTLDEETLRRVEEYRHKHRFSTLSKAAAFLIQCSLEYIENPLEVDDATKEFDAISKMDDLMKELSDMKENMIRHREKQGEK
jgi:hypothetical protein